MLKTVHYLNFYLIMRWMSRSVSMSILAVASSRSSILFWERRALAKHNSCFYPAEKYTSLLSQIVSNWEGRDSINSFKVTSSRASHSSQSDWSVPKGCRFLRIESWKRKGCWGMMEIAPLNLDKLISPISSPSINILPSESISWSHIKLWIIELLPAPVLPTIPTLDPGLIVKFTERSTQGKSAL